MLDLLLPIAGVWINLGAVAGVGLLIGFVSGLFGVGGGFLMTPILIFLGVPPSIAVATGSAQLVASATFSATVAARQRAIDPRLSVFLIAGALTGTLIGIGIFNLLSRLGSLEGVIGVAYVVLLGTVGGLMLKESVTALRHTKAETVESPLENAAQRWLQSLPILVTMVAATLLHAIFNHAIDIVLAVPLILGGVFGAHLGTMAGRAVNGVQFRLALATLILLVAFRFLYSLVSAVLMGHLSNEAVKISLAALPDWEGWIALQASNNSAFYGLVTAVFAVACGYFGARLFDRD